MNNKRIAYIDIMKGIAILSVVIGHYLSSPPLQIIIWSFHMPLFIFLNGYFFKDGPIVPRIKKAATAYEKPYLIVWCLLLLLEFIIAFIEGEDLLGVATTRLLSGVWALASNRTLFIPAGVIKIGAIWFLNALFWGTVFLSFIVKIRSKVGQFVSVIFLLLVGVFITSKICVPMGLNYGVAFLMWLWIGYLYSNGLKARWSFVKTIESKIAVIASLWVAIVLIEGITHNQYNICWLRFPLFGLELIGAFCGIMVIMYISKLIDGHTRYISSALQNLGKASLLILCVHALDIELFPHFSTRISSFGGLTNLMRGAFDLIVALSLYYGHQQIKVKRLSTINREEEKQSSFYSSSR